MKNCKYSINLNGEVVNFATETELNKFIKENYYKIKFDGDEAIYSLSNKALVIYDKLSSVPSTSGINIKNFLESKQKINNEEKLLVPEYIEENRRLNTRIQYKTLMNSNGKPFVEAEFEKYWNTLLKNDRINLEFGGYLHKLIDAALKTGIGSREYNLLLNNLNSPDFEKYIGEGNYQIAKSKLHQITQIICDKLDKSFIDGHVFVNFKVSAEDYLGRTLSDKIDIIGIDKSGKISIFNINLSKDSFDNWDSAKKEFVNYELMTYRQMLAQHGLNASEIDLYTIPIKYEAGDINSIQEPDEKTIVFQKLNIAKLNSNDGLEYFGKKSGYLKQLIPYAVSESSININEKSDKIDNILQTIFPKFNFKSQLINDDFEEIYNTSLKNKDDSGEYKFYNAMIKGYVSGIKTEDKLKEAVQKYVKELSETKNFKIKNATDSLKGFVERGESPKDLFFTKNTNVQSAYINTFQKYVNGDWRVIESEVLINAGMIGFENITTGQLDFISLTVNNLNISRRFAKGDKILGNFYSNEDIRKNNFIDILDATSANIELVKSLVVLNNLPEFFADNRKLGQVKVMNYTNGSVYDVELNQLINNFSILMSEVGEKNNISDSIQTYNFIDLIQDEMSALMEESNNPELKNIFTDKDSDELRIFKVEKLEELRNRLVNKFPHLAKGVNENMDFNLPEEKLLLLLSKGILYYKNIHLYQDYAIPKFGATFEELIDWFKAPFSYEDSKIDSKGRMKVGLLGGTYLSSTDTLASKDMRNIFQLFNIAIQEQRDLFGPKMAEITSATKEYQRKSGHSEMSAVVLSNTYKLNKVLYKTLSNGQLDPDMLFKNPYKDSDLKPHESDYLKYMLWQINKWKIKELSQEERNLDYKSAEKLDKVAIEISKGYSGAYFSVPLEKGMDYTRLKGMTTENLWDSFKDKISDMKDWFDKREITEEQKIDIGNQVKNYNFMSNRFRMSDYTRQKMLSSHDSNYWEINLDKIVLDYEKEYIQENAINKVLPTVNSALLVLKFYAKQSGQDIKNTVDYFYDQIRASIFNESIINEEAIDALKVVNFGKKLLSLSSLALRPSLLIKETCVGTITNVIRAATKVYGDNSFDIKDLQKAYSIMLGANKKFSRDFNLINAIDYTYGLSNMDINAIVSRTRSDRSGLMSGMNKHLFWTSTQADYFNRMTLFIAQMIHDGTWDAHSLGKNGELIYDPTKDKRFDEYFKHKDNTNYSSENFLKQKAAYISLIKQLKSEGVQIKGKEISFNDNPPKAYTTQDRESLKSFADLAYGYYDHEKQSLVNHMAFGALFMQFMTYWTAKVKTWTIKPGTETAQGQMIDKVIYKDGKEVPVYLKPILDENGEIIDFEETTETDGTYARSRVWKGTRMEGLAWSLLYTTRDLIHLKFTDAFADKNRNKRVALAMHDLLWASLGMFLARLMWLSLKGELNINEKDSDNSFLESQILMLEKTNYRVLSEFNPYSNILGNLTFEPRFATFGKKLANDLVGTITGDKKLDEFAKKYVKAMEITPL